MAQVGINTLLIDANLRGPSIQDFIVPSRPVIGLSECLENDTLPMSSAVQALQPSLSVLYAGHVDSSSHERIGGNVFKSIMSSCLRDYDLTILDTPPANRYADARRIASLARYALVVACCKRSYLKDIRTLLTEMESDRTTAVGTYLNDY
jgi:Mrp family chromosome partitioning ATPase